jgi:SEC-C motif domain protein
MATSQSCPCGEGLYETCCAPLHNHKRQAESALVLMRSRYSAFALGLVDYIALTQREQTSAESRVALQIWTRSVVWLSLQIVSHSDAEVEFRARYIEGRRLVTLSERSSFAQQESRWMYLEGEPTTQETTLDMKSICPCGSGQKFGRCHA